MGIDVKTELERYAEAFKNYRRGLLTDTEIVIRTMQLRLVLDYLISVKSK